jgi:hypothetical protein
MNALPMKIRRFSVVSLTLLLCSQAHAGFFKNDEPEPVIASVLYSENFDEARVADVPAPGLAVGTPVFYSDKPALSIVGVGRGNRALSLAGSYLKLGIAPSNLGQGQALRLQFTITYPKGPVEDKPSLRFGFYNVADVASTTSVASDQGLALFTNASVDAKTGTTGFTQDLNCPDRSGKWPGVIGGGPGARGSSEKSGCINFQNKPAQVTLTIAPIYSMPGVNPSWQATVLIKSGKKTLALNYIFPSSSQFDCTSFNTVCIRVGVTEIAYIDDLSVKILKLADAQ